VLGLRGLSLFIFTEKMKPGIPSPRRKMKDPTTLGPAENKEFAKWLQNWIARTQHSPVLSEQANHPTRQPGQTRNMRKALLGELSLRIAGQRHRGAEHLELSTPRTKGEKI
jgi:hypothetical protein